MNKKAFLETVLQHLSVLDGVRSRAMFGGYGLYLGDSFFAVVDDGHVYFRVTDETRGDYEGRGMGPFRPDGVKAMRGYYEVPPEVWDDPVLLREWALRSADR
jgi:DNA transformation protein